MGDSGNVGPPLNDATEVLDGNAQELDGDNICSQVMLLCFTMEGTSIIGCALCTHDYVLTQVCSPKERRF